MNAWALDDTAARGAQRQIWRLEVAGIAMVAIPLRDWRSRRQRADAAAGEGAPRLGGLVLNGERYALISEAELPPKPAQKPLTGSLTARELQVAHAIAEGKSDKETARLLGISEYTVREHVRRVFHKLNVSKRTTLVAALLEQIRSA
jgi:DNA-binding CsgD family transcriptional regulator